METKPERQKLVEERPFVIPPSDCLVEIGHSIVKGQNENWYLSPLLQSVIEMGEAPDGFKKFIRTGIKASIDQEDKSAIVGGGVLTTAATVEAVEELAAKNLMPKVVVHTGGRPGYLENGAADNPDLSEGKIMQEFFNSRLKAHGKIAEEIPQELIESGKNTEDDIRAGLETALKHNCQSVSFIALGVRLIRCIAFYEKIISENDSYKNLRVNFLATEDIISNIAARKGRSEQWKWVLYEYQNSAGYKRTFENEFFGAMAVLAGTYGQAPGGTGKT